MLKRQRNYRAEFEIGSRDGNKLVPEHTLTISYPYTCQFNVSTGINRGENRAVFQFINLSEIDRADLWIDTWNIAKRYIYMKFYAGYGDTMPLIFEGFVQSGTSGKDGGSTETITTIQAFDEGHLFRFGYLNATFTEKTKLSDILKVALEGTNLKVGYITPDILPLRRNKTYIGQTLDLLSREYSGYSFFVSKGQLHVLGDRDVVPGEIPVIGEGSGLLGSPRRGSSFVECTSAFEPQITAGQAIILQSTSLPWLNQSYKVVRVEHAGIISPVISSDLITNLTLTAFDEQPRVLEKTEESTYKGQPTTGLWQKPVQGQVTSPFGPRPQPVAGASTNHKGMDIGAAMNAPVYAPANGRVIAAYINGSLTSGFGRFISIDHGTINGKNVTSWYGHLSSWVVHSGQYVEQGQLIGYVGSTGYSNGPHLHFQINENNTPVNPTKYIGYYG